MLHRINLGGASDPPKPPDIRLRCSRIGRSEPPNTRLEGRGRRTGFVIAGIGSGTVLLLIFGSALVSNAVILAVATTAGLLFITSKLPHRIKQFLVKHSLITDMSAATATYLILGKNVTSLLAAGFVGCLTSTTLWGLKPLLLKKKKARIVLKIGVT